MTSQGGNLLGKERTSSIPVRLVMNVSGYGIDLHVGNRVIDMEDFLTTESVCTSAVKTLSGVVSGGKKARASTPIMTIRRAVNKIPNAPKNPARRATVADFALIIRLKSIGHTT